MGFGMFAITIFTLSVFSSGGCSKDRGMDPLTQEEREWLTKHNGKIVLAHDPNAKPIDFIDKNGEFRGLSADYVKLIEKKLNFKFNIVHPKTWDLVIEKAKNREIDVLGAFSKNAQREKWMFFTDPYIEVPTVILTRKDVKGTLTLEKMKNMKVTFTKGWIIDEFLKENYSYLDMIPVIDEKTAMNYVSMGQADAWVTALSLASLQIEENKITNLRVAGETELSFKLAMASRKDWPILHQILKKGLILITEEEKSFIFKKWIHIEGRDFIYNKKFLVNILIFSGIILLIIIIIIVWNLSLRRQVEQRTKESTYELTENKRRESELLLFKDLINQSNDSVFVIDPETSRFLDVNDEACTSLGYEREELIKMGVIDIDTNLPSEPFWEDHVREVKERGHFVFEGEHKQKNGTTLPVEISIKLISQKDAAYIVAVARDITERKRAEEAQRESEERYRTILENMEEGYYEVDLAGNFTFFNDAMCKIRGISRDDLMGMNNRDYMAPETAEEVYEAFNRVYTTGEPDKNLVWVTIRPDGTQSYLETSASLIKDSRDEPTGFRGIVRDVTERRHSEEEQIVLKAQLQQAQKMEAIGTLAGGIAHDFNNILTAIRGFTEIVLNYELPEEAPARYSLGQVLIASDRARDLVQQILTFSRIKEHEVLPVNISPIIKEALKLLRATLPATIDIRQEIMAMADSVLCDPTLIHQVLMNLCTNAYQSMPDEKGVLTVSLVDLHLDSEGAGHYSDIEPGQHLELAVSDTGQGIEPDNIDRIFEPYFTTKTVSEGTGLGLAVVHGIVKSLGGDITVASELGKGSVFQVILPVIKQTNLMEKETLEHLLKGNEHILFIDDERFIVEMGTTMLEALGYKVSAYMNPLEALTAFRASPKEFDLVITDMTMPEMTGDILAEKILDIQPGLPVIICTGYSNLMSPDRARSIGIRELVEKPYTSEEIALAVRRLLDTD